MVTTETQSILVVGGGISGLTAAIEAAEAGYDAYIVEKNPYVGGRVAQLHNYFPKLCPPCWSWPCCKPRAPRRTVARTGGSQHRLARLLGRAPENHQQG